MSLFLRFPLSGCLATSPLPRSRHVSKRCDFRAGAVGAAQIFGRPISGWLAQTVGDNAAVLAGLYAYADALASVELLHDKDPADCFCPELWSFLFWRVPVFAGALHDEIGEHFAKGFWLLSATVFLPGTIASSYIYGISKDEALAHWHRQQHLLLDRVFLQHYYMLSESAFLPLIFPLSRQQCLDVVRFGG